MSSKRNLRRHQCGDKRAYPSEQEARRHQGALLRLCGRRQSISTYRCHFCGQWHVGHTPKRNLRLMAAGL